jgi:hypothetical protein
VLRTDQPSTPPAAFAPPLTPQHSTPQHSTPQHSTPQHSTPHVRATTIPTGHTEPPLATRPTPTNLSQAPGAQLCVALSHTPKTVALCDHTPTPTPTHTPPTHHTRSHRPAGANSDCARAQHRQHHAGSTTASSNLKQPPALDTPADHHYLLNLTSPQHYPTMTHKARSKTLSRLVTATYAVLCSALHSLRLALETTQSMQASSLQQHQGTAALSRETQQHARLSILQDLEAHHHVRRHGGHTRLTHKTCRQDLPPHAAALELDPIHINPHGPNDTAIRQLAAGNMQYSQPASGGQHAIQPPSHHQSCRPATPAADNLLPATTNNALVHSRPTCFFSSLTPSHRAHHTISLPPVPPPHTTPTQLCTAGNTGLHKV